jgi:hypothetical protein
MHGNLRLRWATSSGCCNVGTLFANVHGNVRLCGSPDHLLTDVHGNVRLCGSPDQGCEVFADMHSDVRLRRSPDQVLPNLYRYVRLCRKAHRQGAQGATSAFRGQATSQILRVL